MTDVLDAIYTAEMSLKAVAHDVDEEHRDEFELLVSDMRDLRVRMKDGRQLGEPCDECGNLKEYVDEPMVSGFVGYICVNEICPIDS